MEKWKALVCETVMYLPKENLIEVAGTTTQMLDFILLSILIFLILGGFYSKENKCSVLCDFSHVLSPKLELPKPECTLLLLPMTVARLHAPQGSCPDAGTVLRRAPTSVGVAGVMQKVPPFSVMAPLESPAQRASDAASVGPHLLWVILEPRK